MTDRKRSNMRIMQARLHCSSQPTSYPTRLRPPLAAGNWEGRWWCATQRIAAAEDCAWEEEKNNKAQRIFAEGWKEARES